MLLSDISQSTGRDVIYPAMTAEDEVRLTEVVRCSKRIVQAASVVQLGGEQKLHTQCHHESDGPPVKSFLFELSSSSSANRFREYAERVTAALEHLQTSSQGSSSRIASPSSSRRCLSRWPQAPVAGSVPGARWTVRSDVRAAVHSDRCERSCGCR